MQRILERAERAGKQARKKSLEKLQAKKRSESWQRNQNRIHLLRANHDALREDRKNRRIDWDCGTLAPRRDVGTKAKTFGTRDMYNMHLPERDPEYRTKPKNRFLRKGDRVVVTAGRDRGKIGKVKDVDWTRSSVQVEGMNTIDVDAPQWIKDENGDQRDFFTHDSSIRMEDIKLVYPLPDPVTGVFRDAVVEGLVGSGEGRVIAGTNTIIPWPEEQQPIEPDEFEDDTPRISVEERTFLPYLIRPPMPLTVIDELRHKYSKFRTRHSYEFTARMLAEDEKVEARKGLLKTMRTPLQELADVRQKKKQVEERDLTPEQLAKIGEVIAQEQRKRPMAEEV